MRDGLGADRLAGARGPGEIEGDRETGWMPLPKAPEFKDEVVLRYLRQRRLERAARRWGQDDVLESPSQNNRFRRAAPRHTEELGDRRAHLFTLTCPVVTDHARLLPTNATVSRSRFS